MFTQFIHCRCRKRYRALSSKTGERKEIYIYRKEEGEEEEKVLFFMTQFCDDDVVFRYVMYKNESIS